MLANEMKALNQSTLDELQDYAVDQNRTALNNRVNELGVGNAVVQRQGADRIVVTPSDRHLALVVARLDRRIPANETIWTAKS